MPETKPLRRASADRLIAAPNATTTAKASSK
jgi:hypothetical protein